MLLQRTCGEISTGVPNYFYILYIQKKRVIIDCFEPLSL